MVLDRKTLTTTKQYVDIHLIDKHAEDETIAYKVIETDDVYEPHDGIFRAYACESQRIMKQEAPEEWSMIQDGDVPYEAAAAAHDLGATSRQSDFDMVARIINEMFAAIEPLWKCACGKFAAYGFGSETLCDVCILKRGLKGVDYCQQCYEYGATFGDNRDCKLCYLREHDLDNIKYCLQCADVETYQAEPSHIHPMCQYCQKAPAGYTTESGGKACFECLFLTLDQTATPERCQGCIEANEEKPRHARYDYMEYHACITCITEAAKIRD